VFKKSNHCRVLIYDLLFCFVFQCVLFSHSAEAGFGGHQSLRISTRDYVEIPLEKDGNAFFLNVSINGHKTKFLLDTGATSSVLSSSVQEKYDVILTGRKAVFSGISGQTTGVGAIINDFVLGEDVFLGKFRIWIIPDPFQNRRPGVAGILGEDVLSKYDGFIDHNSNRLFLKKKGLSKRSR